MWKKIADALWRVVRVAEETERNRQNLKELEKLYRELAAVTERKYYESQLFNERLTHEVQRLTDEVKRLSEREESERRILKIELENYLLRQERGLPPAEPKQLPQSTSGTQDESDKKSKN